MLVNKVFTTFNHTGDVFDREVCWSSTSGGMSETFTSVKDGKGGSDWSMADIEDVAYEFSFALVVDSICRFETR